MVISGTYLCMDTTSLRSIPHFIDRISIIAAYNLKLALFTNGSGLTKPVLEFWQKAA